MWSSSPEQAFVIIATSQEGPEAIPCLIQPFLAPRGSHVAENLVESGVATGLIATAEMGQFHCGSARIH